MVKHLGDLFADDDNWSRALDMYEASRSQLEKETSETWTDYFEILRSITTQSVGAALRTSRGATAASAYLVPKTAAAELTKHPLFLLNVAHDAYMAEVYASGRLNYGPDRRAAILMEPLLLKSHDLSSALQSWSDGEYRDAEPAFWSVLRRQIALGSAVEMRVTQAYYSRCVFDRLSARTEREVNKSSFALGIRLIVQSAQATVAEKMRWSEEFVRAYVDDDAFNLVVFQVDAIDASRDERLRVAIELIRGWCLVLPVERSDLGRKMLRFVIEVGLTAQTSFAVYLDIGGRCLAVIRDLAEKRPEFRTGIVDDIAKLVISKMQKGAYWTARADALKLASLYLGVINPEDARAIVYNVLAQLDGIDPAREEWPIVQPALDVIVADEVESLAKGDAELSRRIVSTVLRFGLNQKTEHVRLLHYLYRFDLASIHEEPALSQLREVVLDVRKQALTINASNSINNVCALLLASSAVGKEGVTDALEAIRLTLQSGLGQQPFVSLSLAFAYQALIILAERREKIANDIGMAAAEFDRQLLPILNLVIDVWTAAIKNPLVFALFSFPPPTKPDPIIIHNWTFGSIAFAKSLGQLDRIQATLDLAAENPTLKDPIASGRAVRLASGERETLNPDAIRSESAWSFYSALGQRLVFLPRLTVEERDRILDALLDQCLRFGPNGLDAAVFLAVGESKMAARRSEPDCKDYVQRVTNNRALRLTLMPFLVASSPNA